MHRPVAKDRLWFTKPFITRENVVVYKIECDFIDFLSYCVWRRKKRRRKKYKNSVIYSVNICQIYTQRT